MNQRDRQVVKAIEKFHCLNRDDVIRLFFPNHKAKIACANKVLRRLVDREQIKVERTADPFIYFPFDSKMRPNSQKIDHYRHIFNAYLQLRSLGRLRQFEVEPTLGKKGTVEPDAFCIFRGTPFFIEIQMSNFYTKNYMLKKLARYEQYRVGKSWEQFDWQPKDKKFFPRIWMIGEKKYSGIPGILQTENVEGLIKIMEGY